MSSSEKSAIVVLHVTKYGDSGAIVHAIDSRAGRISIFLRGLGKGNKRVLASFHPLSVLNVVISQSPKSELFSLKEQSPALDLPYLRSDLRKNAIAIFISEVLYRSILHDFADTQFFSWLCGVIADLESAADEEIANFHLLFLVGLCSKMGFLPADNYSEQAPFFEVATASFVRKANYPSPTFDADSSTILHNMMSLPKEKALRLALNGRQRNSFCGKTIEFLSYHLGISINIKSLAVLRELF